MHQSIDIGMGTTHTQKLNRYDVNSLEYAESIDVTPALYDRCVAVVVANNNDN